MNLFIAFDQLERPNVMHLSSSSSIHQPCLIATDLHFHEGQERDDKLEHTGCARINLPFPHFAWYKSHFSHSDCLGFLLMYLGSSSNSRVYAAPQLEAGGAEGRDVE
jgi:hypothetical protein